MPSYLSQEWLDAVRALTHEQHERPVVSARIQHVVSGGPDGDIRYYEILEDGKLVESGLGEIADPDVTTTTRYEDAARIHRGELEPSVAFMQGRLKVAGDMGTMMTLLAHTKSEEHEGLRARIRDITEL